MVDPTMTTTTPVDDAPLPGLLSRAIGVITSPGETFKHVARTPKVAGMLFLVGLVIALAQGLPQFTEEGRAMALDMQVQSMERFGMTVTDEMYTAMVERSQSNVNGYVTVVSTMVVMPLASVVITAILWAIFNAILGGTATFKHVMAIVVHSQIISALSVAVASPIMYARGQMSQSGIANLGALVPMLDESNYIARVLGMVDLFVIWWLVVLAIGLAALYKRTTTGVATGLLIAYLGLVLIFASFFGG